MSRASLCLVAVLSLAWARPAPAQTPPSQPARDTPAAIGGSAAIRGRVVDAATGRALSRVEMRAGPNPGQVNSRIVITDGEGRYEIKGLPAGVYTIIAAKPNYVRTSWGEPRPEGPGKRITLTDGQMLDKIDLRLVRAGVITGRVLDEFGDPITDVQVMPMRYVYQQGTRRLTPSGRSGQTNDIGDYRIYGLSPGQYYVSAALRNFSMSQDNNNTDRSGYAATFFPGTGNVAEAQRLTIAPGQTIGAVNMTLLPIQTSRVSGVALDSQGRPVAGAYVNAMQRMGFYGYGGPPAQTRADGKFTVTGLAPGEYILRLNMQGSQDMATALVTIDGGDVTDVQLVATKPSAIRGRIVMDTDAPAPKLSEIVVNFVRPDPMVGGFGQARPKEDFTFDTTLPAGLAFIRAPVTVADTPWRLNRVMVNGVDVADTGVEIPPDGALSDVVVELTSHMPQISGRVADAGGKTVRDCYVIVFAQDPSRWTVQSRYATVSRPGLDDNFHARLPPGDYYGVAITDVEPGAWTDPSFLSQARDRATPFTLAPGETKSVDLPLSPPPVF